MTIDNLTIKEARELAGLFGNSSKGGSQHPFTVGKNYLIGTVTKIYTGKIEAVYDQEIVLSGASWIADTGRFYNALKEGNLSEVEPFINNVVIGRGSIVEATEWDHALPNKQI